MRLTTLLVLLTAPALHLVPANAQTFSRWPESTNEARERGSAEPTDLDVGLRDVFSAVSSATSVDDFSSAPAADAGLVAEPGEWSRFRGPNGSGLSEATRVPTEFGPDKNVLWRLPLPQGHSSPILFGKRIYLTGMRADETLVTIAIDRDSGKLLWERAAPKVTTKVVDKRNNPASPSPAVEANGIYVFFPDYGMVAYDAAGTQLWSMPLGPFNNIYGMGASPVIVGDNVVLACDQSLGSYVMAVNKRTGKIAWKVDRPEAKSGHSTPIIWRDKDGKDQILLPGSFLLTSYDAATGKKLWWVGGLSFEMKSTPVIGGDTIYVNGYGAPVNDPGNKVTVPEANEVWPAADADKNGVLSKAEFP